MNGPDGRRYLSRRRRPAARTRGGGVRDRYDSNRCGISSVSVLEAETVMRRRRGDQAALGVRRLLTVLGVEIVAFDDDQCRVASRAYATYGKGIHPAGLNICDCAAYALAVSRDVPLLFKGDDFTKTDITAWASTGD